MANIRRAFSRLKYTQALNLHAVLHDLHASEGNVSIASLGDRGWTVSIMDSLNRSATERLFTGAEFDLIAPWLARTFADLHPTSRFAAKYNPIAPRFDAAPQSTVAWYFSSSSY